MNQGSSNQHSLHESRPGNHAHMIAVMTSSQNPTKQETSSCTRLASASKYTLQQQRLFISFTVQRLYILFPLLSLSLILNVSLPFLVAPYLYRVDYL
jgi:hypothetical protein